MPQSVSRILVAIPAYNEEYTIADVVRRVQQTIKGVDLLVIDDGSQDDTAQILEGLDVLVATHHCNLGYGRAIQTAIKYAIETDYDALVTLDADGQHHPEQINGMVAEFIAGGWDVLIGSRHLKTGKYSEVPIDRRIGMQVFSTLLRLVVRRRIYDTSSGLKVIRKTAFGPLTHWHFVDFHAEALVYLIRLGFRVGEYPITAGERTHGESMHSPISYLKYPLKTSLMVLLGLIEASLMRRRK
jgi:glycosyltransferase involved in cell wall biosynthesis